MDEQEPLYPYENFACDDPLDFRGYFEGYTRDVRCETGDLWRRPRELLRENRDAIFKLMGLDLSEQEKAQLVETCSPSALTVEDEISQESALTPYKYTTTPVNYEIQDSARDLQIIQCKEKWKFKIGKTQSYSAPKRDVTPLDKRNLNPYKDIVVIAKIYSPFKYIQENNYYRKGRINATHEIAILASQTLTDLREKLLCCNDLGYTVELNSPKETMTPQIKSEYPSGFLFIENVFYNDMRHANSVDYSEVIRDWAVKKKLGTYGAKDMHKTKIMDLKLRIGYPYLYQHQGDCEHIIIFSDVRLLREHDPLTSSCYPYFQLENRYASIICFICGLRISRFLVTDSDRLPHKYSYFCRECLLSYNYIDGKKIGRFKLYPYFDKASVLPS